MVLPKISLKIIVGMDPSTIEEENQTVKDQGTVQVELINVLVDINQGKVTILNPIVEGTVSVFIWENFLFKNPSILF